MEDGTRLGYIVTMYMAFKLGTSNISNFSISQFRRKKNSGWIFTIRNLCKEKYLQILWEQSKSSLDPLRK